MHVHHRQDESLTVERGTIGYRRKGEEPRTAGPGETVTFRAGEVHRSWNAGDDVLECDGWIGPPDNMLFPVVLAIGRVLGRHRRFADAPAPRPTPSPED